MSLDAYRPYLSEADMVRLTDALARPLGSALRINTLHRSAEAAWADWPARYGWSVEPVPWCAAGMRFAAPVRGLGATVEYRMGGYYIQDAASMLPAELFSPHPAPLILDLAAAPGGKTTHLADRFGDRGVIVANDRSAGRLAALRTNLQTWGIFGALVTGFPGERFGGWFADTFDRVLIDAPCSGDTLRPEKGRKAREVSAKEQRQLHQRQVILLESAIAAAAPSGEIVYSTCTLNPLEDEGVIDAVLRRWGGRVVVEAASEWGAPGLAEGYAPGVGEGVRLWPHLYQTSGFFAARLRKLDSNAPGADAPPVARGGGSAPLTAAAEAAFVAGLRDDYGFDFAAVMADYDLELRARGDLIFAAPARALRLFGDLPTAAVGLLAGQMSAGAVIPSHELVARFADCFALEPLPPDHVADWLGGIDIRADLGYAPGRVVLFADADGRYVGRGKVVPGRVRNLLPRAAVR